MIDIILIALMILLLPLGLFLIGIILIQESKSGGLSGAFGGGGGQSLLGARAGRELSRWTTYGTVIFCVLLLIIGILCNYQANQEMNKGGDGNDAANQEAGAEPGEKDETPADGDKTDGDGKDSSDATPGAPDANKETPDVKPDTPDTPATPDAPGTSSTPDAPDAPETSDKPDTPEAPDTPETPDAPDTSKPDTPDTTGN